MVGVAVIGDNVEANVLVKGMGLQVQDRLLVVRLAVQLEREFAKESRWNRDVADALKWRCGLMDGYLFYLILEGGNFT